MYKKLILLGVLALAIACGDKKEGKDTAKTDTPKAKDCPAKTDLMVADKGLTQPHWQPGKVLVPTRGIGLLTVYLVENYRDDMKDAWMTLAPDQWYLLLTLEAVDGKPLRPGLYESPERNPKAKLRTLVRRVSKQGFGNYDPGSIQVEVYQVSETELCGRLKAAGTPQQPELKLEGTFRLQLPKGVTPVEGQLG